MSTFRSSEPSSSILLQREFYQLKSRPKSNFYQVYDLHDDNIHSWIVFVIGPPKTLYAGGVYKAIMRFPETYPMEPPSIQFLCSMYHPNVYSDGKVCISTLQVPGPDSEGSDCHYWRPIIGVNGSLLSVISLLSDPNLTDPANASAALDWEKDKAKLTKIIKSVKEQAAELVPEDFTLPVVLDSIEECERDTENNRSQGDNDCGEFVYTSEDDSEEEMEASQQDSEVTDAGFVDETSTPEGEIAREGQALGDESVTMAGMNLTCEAGKVDAIHKRVQPFIKSGVPNKAQIPGGKRLKLCK